MGHEPAALEFAEPLGEQGAAGPRYPTMDLVEAAGTDHQLANATYFAAAGGAVIVEDAALDGARLRDRVGELRAQPGRLAEMGEGMRSVARPDAAAAVANELLRLARDRK